MVSMAKIVIKMESATWCLIQYPKYIGDVVLIKYPKGLGEIIQKKTELVSATWFRRKY